MSQIMQPQKKPTRPVGRPPRDKRKNPDPARSVRVSDEDWERWHQTASSQGTTVSALIRWLMDHYCSDS